VSLSDYERRVLTEIESDLAADNDMRRRRRRRTLLGIVGIALVLAAGALIALAAVGLLPGALAAALALIVGVIVGVLGCRLRT
jgi:uncharacterized membrane protein YGL010W